MESPQQVCGDCTIRLLCVCVCMPKQFFIKYFLLISDCVLTLCFLPARTPLHCAASCNSVHLCKMLVECGAAIFATTISDTETAADKCEEMEEGYIQCSQFLYGNLS